MRRDAATEEHKTGFRASGGRIFGPHNGYIDVINRDFFKTKFDFPIRAFVLADEKHFGTFLHRELHEPGRAMGIYLFTSGLLASYEDSGLGTFTHETMHAFVHKDLALSPAWTQEGIPTFFEKFYGYGKNDELVLFWGYQNPWRIKALGDNLTHLDLSEIVSANNQSGDESDLRMVSLFLWQTWAS